MPLIFTVYRCRPVSTAALPDTVIWPTTAATATATATATGIWFTRGIWSGATAAVWSAAVQPASSPATAATAATRSPATARRRGRRGRWGTILKPAGICTGIHVHVQYILFVVHYMYGTKNYTVITLTYTIYIVSVYVARLLHTQGSTNVHVCVFIRSLFALASIIRMPTSLLRSMRGE